MKKILAIGGGGLVGWGLVRKWREMGHQVVVGEPSSEGEGVVKLDITDEESMKRGVAQVEPEIIFHLAAATNVNRCEQEPAWAKLLNVKGTKNVVRAAGKIPVIYFSTDFVFSGKTMGLRNEEEMPDPISVYGKTKMEGEFAVLESENPGGVVRITFPWYSEKVHLEQPNLKDTLWWMATTMRSGAIVNAFNNIYASWTAMKELEEKLLEISLKMIEKKIMIVHLAGRSPASPYEVAMNLRKHLNDSGEVNLGEVAKVKFVSEKGKTAARPKHGGLDTRLAEGLGWRQSGILEMVEAGEWRE